MNNKLQCGEIRIATIQSQFWDIGDLILVIGMPTRLVKILCIEKNNITWHYPAVIYARTKLISGRHYA